MREAGRERAESLKMDFSEWMPNLISPSLTDGRQARKCLRGRTTEVLALKHESRILGQWSTPMSGSRKSQASSPWAKQQSLTCSIIEKPHTGLDECPRILLSCFRARNSGGRCPECHGFRDKFRDVPYRTLHNDGINQSVEWTDGRSVWPYLVLTRRLSRAVPSWSYFGHDSSKTFCCIFEFVDNKVLN